MCKRYQEEAGERVARFTKTSNSWTGRENISCDKQNDQQFLEERVSRKYERKRLACRLNLNGCACSEFVSSQPMNHDSHVPLACGTRTVKQNQEEWTTQCLRYEMFGSSAARGF